MSASKAINKAGSAMRKIVAGLYITLDGVVEGGRWQSSYFNAEIMEEINAGIAQADAVLLGRGTYQQFSKIWPSQGSNVPMADFLNKSPKYVVSSSKVTLEWPNSTQLEGDLREELTKLRQQPGKNILIPGSPRLVRSLLRDGLLDQLSLSILPLIAGTGRRLFDEMPNEMPLELVASRTFSNGVLSVTYQPTSA
jgi:dihydrofolate reductase